MKYMTFHSSCSYAGLANLLSVCGVDTEDREIALEMRLPYLFSKEDGAYLAGPMLQGARWFDLYLKPLGFRFDERVLTKDEVCAYLRGHAPAMLGLRVSTESKHAVIYIGQYMDMYRFRNNKRQDSPEPEGIDLSEEELLERLDDSVTVGRLERREPEAVDFRPYLEESVQVLRDLHMDIALFCMQGQSVFALQNAMSDLFRPLLVDGVTMLELLGETETADALKTVRRQFLDIIRAGRSERLEDKLDMRLFNRAIAEYGSLLIRHMETT